MVGFREVIDFLYNKYIYLCIDNFIGKLLSSPWQLRSLPIK